MNRALNKLFSSDRSNTQYSPSSAGNRFGQICSAIFLMLCLGWAAELRADTLSGTVKDPAGLPVEGAKVEVTGENLPQLIALTSDPAGKFAAGELKPGKYSVKVTKEGFQTLISTVDLHGAADLQLMLVIAEQQTSVTVTGKSMAFANSDTVYRQLRDIGLGSTYRCDDVTMPMDVGTYVFKSGTITFLAPVNGEETGAIFVGERHFVL